MTSSLFVWLRLFILASATLLFFSGQAALLDAWRASDLAALDNGDAVGSWTSLSNRIATAPVGSQPILQKSATPSGSPVVHFDHNRMTVPSCPVAGRDAFSLVVVFKADELGVDEGTGWSTKSGIVDANEVGITNDWGFSIRETGYVSFGTGKVGGGDYTVYLDNQPTYPSMVDGRYHVVVNTWGGGSQRMYLDNYPSKGQSGVSAAPRDEVGFSFGGIHTGESTRRFVGDLAEVRFYDTALTAEESGALIAELSDRYLTNHLPTIFSFAASTNAVYAGMPVTLSWAVSNATLVAIDNGVGSSLTLTGSVQVLPAVTTTYTLTASNAAGTTTAQTLVTADPGIPRANSQSVSVVKNTDRSIRLTGEDPQQDPLTYTLVQIPAHGVLSGTPPEVVYTPQADYVGTDFFTFKVNDGAYDSPPASVQIYVDDVAQPPHGIFLNASQVEAGAVSGTFLGVFRAVDTNRFDSHTFTLVPGVGATHNGLFTISGNHLLAGAGFPTSPGTNLYIRVRATDSSGLYLEKVFGLEAANLAPGVVINEIHYNPAENTVREEFIELFNAGSQAVDLSLWRLRGGIDYVFGNGVSLLPGAYVVVAAEPAVIQARYGVSALGPWSGGLASEGERITLRDATDRAQDEVGYGSEFPWPIAANGSGPSMELINPALDNDLGSSWASPLNPAVPSPGARNQVYLANAAPNIRQVSHMPKQPASTQPVTVTAKVTDPQGVISVELAYQVVPPGSYLPSFIPWTVAQLNATPLAEPLPNPEFENTARWAVVHMHDDGMDGDAVAGDDVYTAVLPVQPNRTLVRYRITCTDALEQSRRAPFADDPSLNFAYFVYDGVPAYGGIAASNLVQVPVYFLLTRANDFDVCTAYNGSYQIQQFSGSVANEARYAFNWPGAFVYDGEVYDHVRYRLRGANGRYQNGKRSFRLKFNDGRFFAAKDEFGTPYARKWSHLTTAKGQSNRGTLTFSLNEAINYFLMNQAGVPSPYSHYFHWRVVRGAQEAPDLYNGDFYGISWAQEEYDAEFLEAHHLAKGNLYKMINAARDTDPYKDMVKQRRYQGPYAVTNGGDGVRIQSALVNPSTSQTDDWLLSNVNYTNWYRYHSISEAVRNYDTWPSANKNAAWYFDTNYTAANAYNGRFWTLPWDLTDTWGPTWNLGQDLAWNGIWGSTSTLHTNMQREYRNAMRELRDLLFQSDQINPIIDALAARIAAIAPADLLRWSDCTPSGSSYRSMPIAGPALSSGLAGYVQDMKNFMFTGGYASWWVGGESVSTGGWITRVDGVAADASIPTRPSLGYVGPTGYPLNALTFESSAFGDPQGAGTFAAIQWRVAEVQNTNQPPVDRRVMPPLEWNPVWDSGVLSNWNNRITFPGVYLQTNKVYRARVRHMDNTGRWSKWSNPLQFTPGAADVLTMLRDGLRFSEIMYNPPAWGIYSGDDLEFLELENIGTNGLNLGGLTFTAGITFTFPGGASLEPGQHYLLGRNATALALKYQGLVIDGIYSGKLDNGGETIRLSTPAGETVVEVTYKDSPPWPVTADGLGWSLVLADPAKGTYRPSTVAGGSPGAADAPNSIAGVVINEVLTHTDLPQVDSIELYNPTAGHVNIGGWFLSDDPMVPQKYRIPDNTDMGPGEYRVFTESDFNPGGAGFALSSLGDDLYLFSGDGTTNLTGYVHGAPFGASENGVSFGRYVNSAGDEDFVAMSNLTLGTNNSLPLVGPVVVSEIMYAPPTAGTNEDSALEFIELQNVSTTNVALFAQDFPTNTWRIGNAVQYQFPPGVMLPGYGRLLVVGFDPVSDAAALARFRTQYGLGINSAIYGPWAGRLDNAGETIELKFPDQPEVDGFVPYVMVEKTGYQPAAPWPTGAAGSGQSLQRLRLHEYANEPTNWVAAAPTPGSLGAAQDSDGDGVPDFWEMEMGTRPFVADATEDPDADGFSNYAEWLAGTNPLDASSYLRFEAILPGEGRVTLRFRAMADRGYTVLGTSAMPGGEWSKVADVEPGTNRLVELDQAVAGTMFYRLVTPRN